MDSDRLQHGADVYGAVFDLPRRAAGNQACAVVGDVRFCRGFDIDAVLAEPCGDAYATSGCRDRLRTLLSAGDDLRPAQSSIALHDLWHRRLFDGHPVADLARSTAGSLAHRASLVALALLDLFGANGADDVLHLPGNPAPAAAHRAKADCELGRLLACQSRPQLDL